MFFNKTKKLLHETEQSLNELQIRLNKTMQELEISKTENSDLQSKYAGFMDKDKAIDMLNSKIGQLQVEFHSLNEQYRSSYSTYLSLQEEINLYTDTLEIGSFGLYTPQFDYTYSQQYKDALQYNYEKQKQLIKDDKAAVCHTEWTVGGSKSEGKKMTNQYKKLMLFAFNGECDSCIARVKWNNAGKTRERIEKAFQNINKLGVTQNVQLTNEFLQLKIEELALTHEYELKQHAEKEEQRRIREQMREEEKAQRDYERAQKEAEEEETRFQKALDKVKQELGFASPKDVELLNEQIALLESKLKEAHDKKERAISLAQQTKVGHIYVISNVGSFGQDIFKIGLTRRLDPLDRIRELGDASVPFHFDVHAIIYSENAPQLEYELHQQFNTNRLNRINGRKEFFRVTLDEIEQFVKQHANAEIQFTKLAEAKEYRETLIVLEKLSAPSDTKKQPEKFPASLQ
jgi:hypothetical protein